MTKSLVVVGNGMVGQKLLESAVASGLTDTWQIVAFGEECRPAYDRVHLSAYFDGCTEDELRFNDPAVHAMVDLRIGQSVVNIDGRQRTVTTSTNDVVGYDALVIATGSSPLVPTIAGAQDPGCFVYRTIDDLEAIRSAASDASIGVVIGGGLLGLEAANALRLLGLETHVVEMAPHLMPVQIDCGGADVLQQELTALGIHLHPNSTTSRLIRAGNRLQGLEFSDGTRIKADLVVYSIGIRPRDELARTSGLDLGARGGVAIDDACRTSDPAIFAIGECASHRERIYGLVGPGYAMARVVSDQLAGGAMQFTGADSATELKLMGVGVASFGDAHGTSPHTKTVVWNDPVDRVYRKLVVDAAGTRLLGGVLVGDTSNYELLRQLCISGTALPGRPGNLAMPQPVDSPPVFGVAAIPDDATICNCNNVTKATICTAIAAGAATSMAEVKAGTGAGTGCGSCIPLVKRLLDDTLISAGIAVDSSLCEHFAHTRQELFDIARVRQIRTFEELLEGWGRGRGCEVCKPAIASLLASLWNEYVLDDELVSLQDTNDAFLANIQRDGSYSVVPRVPGGEITPLQLITLGQVARDFDLYSKITGGQRIDLLGARIEQLPAIWRRLIDAGFESGHAYGKALRTVKSCVGTSWCRFGVQDSTSLAIELELRYRGLRSPHKLKSAVSGCARECAEAQSKDFGVIATERGWNLFVCGNGGMRPQHALLLAEDVDKETLIRYVDRFLMFYIRTADRLERTATWLNNLEGGIDYLRHVIVDDSLGLASRLEADMAHHVATYLCEWRATIDDPTRVARFRHFANQDEGDPTLAYRRERGQKRPIRPDERAMVATPVPIPMLTVKHRNRRTVNR